MKILFWTGLLVGLAAISRGAPLSFSSGNGHVALIELYTSEGCSSCPPADKWLTSLRDAPGLWKEFVPVGFHVDYWNGLGWADRYATKAITERQHALVAEWDIPSAYTPCFARDGREWKGKRELKGSPMSGGGRLNLEIGDDGKIAIAFAPDKTPGATGYTVHVALLGNGFTSRVTAGENRGETLRHDFVTLGLVETSLRPGNGVFTAALSLPRSAIKPVPRQAVAAWVTRRGSFVSLQAAGGWLE